MYGTDASPVSYARRSARPAPLTGGAARVAPVLLWLDDDETGAEEVEQHARQGEGGDGENRAGQPEEGAAADDDEVDEDGVRFDCFALNTRGQQVPLDHIDRDIGEGGEDGG